MRLPVMETVAWDQLRRFECALIDASSIEQLVRSDDELTAPRGMDPRTARAFLEKMVANKGFAALLNLLAQFVAYDHLCVERHALESLGLHEGHEVSPRMMVLLQSLKQTEVPLDRLTVIATRVSERVDTHLRSAGRMGFENGFYWFNGDDYKFAKHMVEVHPGSLPPGFADSNVNSGLRAVFYVELMNQARVPIVLHAARLSIMEQICERAARDALAIIAKKANEAWAMRANEKLAELGAPFEVSAPSIQAFILDMAVVKNMSLLDAAVSIKDSIAAQRFRNWFYQLQLRLVDAVDANLEPQTFNMRMKEAEPTFASLKTQMRGTEAAFLAWGDLDPDAYITHIPRRITLKAKASLMAWLFGVEIEGDIARFDVRDPILGPPPRHLQFIASWGQRRARRAQ